MVRTITRFLLFFIFASTAAWAVDLKAGKGVYDRACKACHGPDGTPNAAIAKMFKVEMRDLKAPEVQTLSNAALNKITTEGKGKMVAIKSVAGTSVDEVSAYVKSLK